VPGVYFFCTFFSGVFSKWVFLDGSARDAPDELTTMREELLESGTV
jgi:hypothetical protein